MKIGRNRPCAPYPPWPPFVRGAGFGAGAYRGAGTSAGGPPPAPLEKGGGLVGGLAVIGLARTSCAAYPPWPPFVRGAGLRVLMLRVFLAPTGAMVNSQGLPAPGPRSHSGPRGWKPLAIFRCPFGAENKQRNIKTCRGVSLPAIDPPWPGRACGRASLRRRRRSGRCRRCRSCR